MNSATPTATGTARTIATMLEITVVHSSAATPNLGGSAAGCQTRLVKNGASLLSRDGTAFQVRKPPTRTTIRTTAKPDARTAPAKIRSAWRPVPDAPSSAAGGGATGSVLGRVSTLS